MTYIDTKPYIGRRIAAGVIDYTIIYAFTSVISLLLLANFRQSIPYILEEAPIIILVIVWLLITVGIEISVGATIGNLILGLKAIPMNGQYRKLTFIESLKRHIMDPVDMIFFGLVGVIVIKNTEKNQRIGDLWAKTIVIK
ncbi:RDD family protein [Dokdonia sp.]|uniref:RDD family protein n=1 Tax=Dokdonia sp. TaxID=2024995 RepID=UPI003266DCEE